MNLPLFCEHVCATHPDQTNGGIWYSTSGAAECVEGRSGPCAWRVAVRIAYLHSRSIFEGRLKKTHTPHCRKV